MSRKQLTWCIVYLDIGAYGSHRNRLLIISLLRMGCPPVGLPRKAWGPLYGHNTGIPDIRKMACNRSGRFSEAYIPEECPPANRSIA
eukprot:5375789-Pyramimonas_sp.AAC.1